MYSFSVICLKEVPSNGKLALNARMNRLISSQYRVFRFYSFSKANVLCVFLYNDFGQRAIFADIIIKIIIIYYCHSCYFYRFRKKQTINCFWTVPRRSLIIYMTELSADQA